MLRKALIGTISALTLAGVTLGAAPVSAASSTLRFTLNSGDFQLQHRPRGPAECWHWSRKHGNWTWLCPIQYRPMKHGRHFMYQPYAYGPQNNPYVYNQAPAFSFSFGSGPRPY